MSQAGLPTTASKGSHDRSHKARGAAPAGVPGHMSRWLGMG